MIILYWCGTCRQLRTPGAVMPRYGPSGATIQSICPDCGGPVEVRGIPDDPDDPGYRVPRCATCRAEVRPSSRFCPQCGAPLITGPLPALPGLPTFQREAIVESASAAQVVGYPSAAQVLVHFVRQRLRRQQVARILDLLAEPPQYHQRRQPGDMPGDFDAWFDGGAVRYLTSITEYAFVDGSRASFHDLSLKTLHIELPDGSLVTVEEPPAQPSFGDRVLAAVIAECQSMLMPQDESLPPLHGRPPTQCMIVENMANGGRQEWLYDVTTNRLNPYAIGILDMSREPMNGMYFERGLVQYQIIDGRQALEFSCTLGPRFGRGLRFQIVDTPTHVQLVQPTLLWIS